ncbi:MAG TPA: sugar phosphate nucleotidyltransferase [Pyrinomonadaceae bacterium]|jgi:mannose-1-phosphate guanylyltransferase
MSAISSQHRFSQKLSIRRTARHLRRSERWAVILAGGDGTRLQAMTRSITGDDRPKQFVPLIGGSTLLEQTRRRVAQSILPGQTLFVVTEKHQRFYRSMTDSVSPSVLLEQPANKGTAPAILYALLRVAAKSPKAIVALFPSDHYFADDAAFMSHVDAAFDAVQAHPATITLLGITPTSPETEYGWIEPQQSILGTMPLSITRVSRFWEKPNSDTARMLMNNGCLWNSFVMVGRVDALLKMTRRALPEMYSQFASIMPSFETRTERNSLHQLYSKIQESNFSHEVLAARAEDLTVMRVGDVGWSDLGEPARVLSTLGRIGVQAQMALSAS